VQLIPFNDSIELTKQQDMTSAPDHQALSVIAQNLHIS
jgi:hypothetical protein